MAHVAVETVELVVAGQGPAARAAVRWEDVRDGHGKPVLEALSAQANRWPFGRPGEGSEPHTTRAGIEDSRTILGAVEEEPGSGPDVVVTLCRLPECMNC